MVLFFKYLYPCHWTSPLRLPVCPVVRAVGVCESGGSGCDASSCAAAAPSCALQCAGVGGMERQCENVPTHSLGLT